LFVLVEHCGLSGHYGTGRFFIISSANSPTAINSENDPGDGLRIWASGDRIIIKGSVGAGSVCELFNLQGQKLDEMSLTDGGLNIIELSGRLNGVAVVKVTDGPRVVPRKIVIPKKAY
jgi:hypothetical protein